MFVLIGFLFVVWLIGVFMWVVGWCCVLYVVMVINGWFVVVLVLYVVIVWICWLWLLWWINVVVCCFVVGWYVILFDVLMCIVIVWMESCKVG